MGWDPISILWDKLQDFKDDQESDGSSLKERVEKDVKKHVINEAPLVEENRKVSWADVVKNGPQRSEDQQENEKNEIDQQSHSFNQIQSK